LIFLAVALLIAVAVIYDFYRSKKIKWELQALAMARFDLEAEKLDLRLSSVAILKNIIQKSKLQDPSSIMKFSYVFENSLEKYYEVEKIGSISNEMLTHISALRKTLGFSPLPRGIAVTSTRQFCSGDKCVMQIPEGDNPIHRGMGYVLDCDERKWAVTRPDWPHIQAGTWMHVSVTKPGDGEYAFRTQILEDLDEELVLSHTNKLDRTQQRSWLRIDVNIPVQVTLTDEAHMNDVLSGRIVDISGGGLGMVLPAEMPADATLLLNFKLSGHDKITDLPVKVIRVSKPFDGNTSKIMHSVAFTNEIHSDREKIIRYIFEKQRENLASGGLS
jgi:c-di-GMP-binding flagellar brake protein YcgR